MSEPSFLSWGDVPHRTDTVNTLLKRIAGGVVNGGGGGGGGTTEVYSGVVNPEGVQTATAPAVYVNTAARTLWIKESGAGNTGWYQYI